MSEQQPLSHGPEVVYPIAFDTSTIDGAGVLLRLDVQLRTDAMGMDEHARVDLADNPWYPNLVEYVLANPPRGPKKALSLGGKKR